MNNPNKPIEEMLMEFYDKGFADCEANAIKALALAVKHAVLLEREACAKRCEDLSKANWTFCNFAEAIRSRGEA